jgi:hypothetical protein
VEVYLGSKKVLSKGKNLAKKRYWFHQEIEV